MSCKIYSSEFRYVIFDNFHEDLSDDLEWINDHFRRTTNSISLLAVIIDDKFTFRRNKPDDEDIVDNVIIVEEDIINIDPLKKKFKISNGSIFVTSFNEDSGLNYILSMPGDIGEGFGYKYPVVMMEQTKFGRDDVIIFRYA